MSATADDSEKHEVTDVLTEQMESKPEEKTWEKGIDWDELRRQSVAPRGFGSSRVDIWYVCRDCSSDCRLRVNKATVAPCATAKTVAVQVRERREASVGNN